MSHYNGGADIDLEVTRQNGSLPNLLSYGNGSFKRDDFDDSYINGKHENGHSHENGYLQDGHEPANVFSIILEISEDEKRFGFSVVGGVDEGFHPHIDEVVEGLPADKMGIKVGDEIDKVNEKSIRYSTHAQIVTTIHESVRRGRISLTLKRKNIQMADNTNSLPERGRLGNRNNNVQGVNANIISERTREKLENILRKQNQQMPSVTAGHIIPTHTSVHSNNHGHRRKGQDSPQNNMSPSGSYTSSSTLSLNHQTNATSSSPVKTIDPPFMGMDNYGYEWRQSHYNMSAPAYNVDVHGPNRTSYISSVGSDDTGVPMMDSRDCQAVVSALMRHAVSEDDQGTIDDLRILENTLHTRHFRNALKVQCKIIELENQGRGPHFVNAERDDASAIRSQILSQLENEASVSRHARELAQILDSPNVKEFLMAHDRAAKIDRPNFAETDSVHTFDRSDSRRTSQDRISQDQVSSEDDDQLKIVKIDKAEEPLGATVRNEGSSVVIGRIVSGGAAQKSGLLHEGDEIIEINGVHMQDKSVEEVCELLADMNGTLTFLVKPSNKTSHDLFTSAELHVRALFDYDPNDDEFIPCRELGLSFAKRDVLHIVSQEDPNWWQAWREGTSGNELAGLIPGKNFQKQREELKTKAKKKNEEKPTTCGCFGKSKNSKTLQTEVDEDETLTYEEVGLFHPNRNRKRPIVLIGPTRIGRRELRQRLLQVAPERFGSAIPHTSRRQEPEEINGKEYYFITKTHFKEYVSNGKFVEHGEYGGHFYGTSLDAIKEIIDSGKVCVVNLHCQALKVLRDSSLKPFVVFVCPPTVEKIKRLRRGNIDPFNPGAKLRDEELEDMIFSAQEMEDNFGHYFDKIIVNTDLERTFDELIKSINELEARPQWVPVRWIRQM